MIAADPRPMSSAPLNGTPVRLFVFAGSVIASFWSEERCRETFGAGDYREGWYLVDDDVVELDDPLGWEPLCARVENANVPVSPRRAVAVANGSAETSPPVPGRAEGLAWT
jgi:hypothetical protein